jgi:hypothetical protein
VRARASIVLSLIAAARVAHADASTPARGDLARPSSPTTPATGPLVTRGATYSLKAEARRAAGGWQLVLTLDREAVIDREFFESDWPPLIADFPHQWQCDSEVSSHHLDGSWRNPHEFVAEVPLTARRTRLMIGLKFGWCAMRYAAVDADVSGATPRVRVEYASGVP